MGPGITSSSCWAINFRLTDLQAALGCSQLERIDECIARRVALADRYDGCSPACRCDCLRACPDRGLGLASVRGRDGPEHAARAAATTCLLVCARRSIGVNVHYIPIHTQPFYTGLGFRRGDFPAAERLLPAGHHSAVVPDMTTSTGQRRRDTARG